MFFGNEYWEGTIEQDTSTDTKVNNRSKSAIKLKSGNIAQSVKELKNGEYNISFNYKTLLTGATVTVNIDGAVHTIEAKTSWTVFEKTITITDNNFSITFTSSDNNSCLIGDLLLIPGTQRQYWTQNNNETTTDTVQIGQGIRVDSSTTNTYTTIDSDGNRTFNKTTSNRVAEMTDKGVYANELEVKGQAQVNVLLMQEIDGQSWLTGIGG